MNNKTKTEILYNCAIHKETRKHLLPDLSKLCFEYLCDIKKIPLIKAIDMNDIHLLKYLISKKIGLGKLHKLHRYNEKITALMYAAAKGCDKCVNLLANTIELGIQDEDGWTALMYAVRNNNVKCVKILEKTDEYYIKDNIGWSASRLADRWMDKHIVSNFPTW